MEIGRQWQQTTPKTPIADDTNESNTVRYPMAINIKDMQNTEGCYKIDSYAFERRAAKFGDSLGNSSYVLHFLKNTFWKNSYTIEFEFRTFYPDGMIFLSRVGTVYKVI